MHGLGRRHAPDERDRGFLLRALLPAVPVIRPPIKTWRLWWKGNQGDTPQCVGYAWHGLLRALPLLQREPSPSIIYHAAQVSDEWPGEAYDGTSVRAGAKVLKAHGKLAHYGWAFDLDTALDWVGSHGPVVLGTNWYESMFDPDAQGKVDISGSAAGGHAYLLIGYNDPARYALCQNSWGMDWGDDGRFRIEYDDLARLIAEDGEACTPTE